MNYAPNLPGGDSWSYKYRPITQSEADLVEQLVANGVCSVDTLDYEIENIIYEELEPLFAGAKGIDETASTIQNRVNLYMKEQN